MNEPSLANLPSRYFFEGYVKPVEHDGTSKWALFDCEGEPVCISDNRSSTFFFAAEHDITVRMLN